LEEHHQESLRGTSMLDYQAKLCRSWAQGKKEVNRVYFYGSRVWGGWRENSDLDVFIVAPPGYYEVEQWTGELTKRLRVTVHINDYFTALPELKDRIKASGLLVFSRHGSDADFEFEDELPEFDPDVH
jgi:predicted nucleotidyltransferase